MTLTTITMRRTFLHLLCCVLTAFLAAAPAMARHTNFKVSVYVRAFEVDKMKDTEWLE